MDKYPINNRNLWWFEEHKMEARAIPIVREWTKRENDGLEVVKNVIGCTTNYEEEGFLWISLSKGKGHCPSDL